MNRVFNDICLLDNIVQFLNIEDLKSFSIVDKQIRYRLTRESKEEFKKLFTKRVKENFYNEFIKEFSDNLTIEKEKWINVDINNNNTRF